MDARGRQALFAVLTWLLCLAVLAAGILLSIGYYTQGRNLREVDMIKYAKVEMEDEVYTVSVDADAIVKDFRLPNPKNTTLDLSRYPDVETVYSLTFLVTPQEAGGWLIQTGSDRPTASDDLRKGGLKLVNTEWTWNEQDMKNAYRAGLEYPRRLSMKKYVLCGKNSMGGYVLTVDRERMLRAAGWDLPDDEATRKAHTGYKAIMSLGYYVTPLVEGFLVETSSTLENVYAMLMDNGVRLTDTTWTYTLAEVEELYTEQHEAAAPEDEPDAPAEAEGGAPVDEGPAEAEYGQVLNSLYHVDQTPVRQAIRQAKEQKYGKNLKSSEIIGNFFLTARDDTAEHGNFFRIVYAISTTGGKEYLIADVFDLRRGVAPVTADVKLTVKQSVDEAETVAHYNVYTLTDGSMVYGEDGGASPYSSDGLVFPNSLTERITDEDVWSLCIPEDKTLLQLLGYGRNEIFARCGNKFSDTSVYTRFYSNYSWYQPKGSVSFNTIKAQYPVAAENIEYIKVMEKLIKEG